MDSIHILSGNHVIYTGTGVLFDFQVTAAAGAGREGWRFEDLGYWGTQGAASLFAIDRSEADLGVIYRCFWRGGYYGAELGTTAQTGNGLTLYGVFNSMVDPSSFFRGWNIATKLRNCDINIIGGDYRGNGCHIYNETPFPKTGGNDNIINGQFLGSLMTSAYSNAEGPAMIYDKASSTRIYPGECENAAAVGGVCLDLAGTGTLIYGGQMNLSPLWPQKTFRLRGTGRDITWYSPRLLSNASFPTPIVDIDPTFAYPGNLNSVRGFYMDVVDADLGFKQNTGDSFRVRFLGGDIARNITKLDVARFTDSRPCRISTTPLDSQLFSSNMPVPISDAASPFGWVWRFAGSTGDEAALILQIGKDIMPNDVVYVRLYFRAEAPIASNPFFVGQEDNAGSTIASTYAALSPDTDFHAVVVGPFTITGSFGQSNLFRFRNDGVAFNYTRIAQIEILQARSPEWEYTQYASLANGGTTVIGPQDTELVHTSGTIAGHTFTLPTAALDGDGLTIVAIGEITAVTWGGTTAGAPTTLTAGTRVTLKYRASNTTWYLS